MGVSSSRAPCAWRSLVTLFLVARLSLEKDRPHTNEPSLLVLRELGSKTTASVGHVSFVLFSARKRWVDPKVSLVRRPPHARDGGAAVTGRRRPIPVNGGGKILAYASPPILPPPPSRQHLHSNGAQQTNSNAPQQCDARRHIMPRSPCAVACGAINAARFFLCI